MAASGQSVDGPFLSSASASGVETSDPPGRRSALHVRTISPLRPLRLRLPLLVALSVLACAAHTRQTVDFDTTVDFSAARELAFFEDTEAGAAHSPGLHRDLTRSAIKRELVASGHRFVSPLQASLLVVYHVGSRAKTHTTGMIDGEVGTEGVMVISFRDPKTQRSVWWGSSALRIDKHTKPRHEIDRLAQSLLRVFPPPPGTKSDYPLE